VQAQRLEIKAMGGFRLVPLQASDWPAVQRIYAEGIATGNATFETAVTADWTSWDAGKRPDCRLVAKSGDNVIGWAALSPVSKRAVYAGVAEVSVYVADAARGKGVGKALLQALVRDSEDGGVWTLMASIFPENEASIHIHEQCGFRLLGRRHHIAQQHGIWRDTVILERRSQVVGV
jgi:phosphinothricin acetyltransferase